MRRSVGIGALAVAAFLMRDRLRALVGRAAGRSEQAGRAVGARRSGMRTADDLARRVKSELGASTGNVDVNAEDGRVQLHGEAESQGMIDELGSRARSVEGVREVDNLLHLPSSEARPNQ
jgi:osmotically-inducible protein OsmY